MIIKPRDNALQRNKDAGDWFTAARFAALLTLLIATWFPLVIAGVKTFVNRDFGRFAYPVAFYFRESFWRGEIPLWNPESNCGLPFLAQWNTMALYPLSWFYLLLPLPWSLGVFCLGHLLLAGVGMYLLAHRWTGSPLAAAVGGVAFAFNGLTWYGLIWPNITAALAWMPWVVLTAEAGCRQGRRWLVLAALGGRCKCSPAAWKPSSSPGSLLASCGWRNFWAARSREGRCWCAH